MVARNKFKEGNQLQVTHGLRMWNATGKMPKGCSYLQGFLNQFRKELEKAVEAEHGKIGIYHAALIQTATRHEGRALLCQRLLRKKADTMTPEQTLVYAREIGNASDSRDKALKAAGLDKFSKPDVWAVLLQKPESVHTVAPMEIEDLATK
jgi:hypothetical protein